MSHLCAGAVMYWLIKLCGDRGWTAVHSGQMCCQQY